MIIVRPSNSNSQTMHVPVSFVCDIGEGDVDQMSGAAGVEVNAEEGRLDAPAARVRAGGVDPVTVAVFISQTGRFGATYKKYRTAGMILYYTWSVTSFPLQSNMTLP